MLNTDRLLGESKVITFYVIERQYGLDRAPYYAGKWSSMTSDSALPEDFGERYPDYYGKKEKCEDTCPFHHELSPSGKCWQLIGVHGYLNWAMAVKAFDAFKIHHRNDPMFINWRLTSRMLYVENSIIEQVFG